MPTSEPLNNNAHVECIDASDKQNGVPSKEIMKVNSQKTSATTNAKKNSASNKKRPLDPQELNMIQTKISQLETESSIEDEEEKAIGT